MSSRLPATAAIVLLLSCAPEPPPATYWSAGEVRVLRSLSLASLGDPPPAPGNRVATDPRAVALGKALFFDERLSGGNDLACASCHRPERHFTDGLPRGVGVNPTARNTPSIVGGAWQTWFYWDGRRDSLWAQALIPIEAPDEMGGSRLAAVRLVGTDPDLRQAYTDLFGAFPDALLASTMPARAGPFAAGSGRDAWARLRPPQQASINRVYANIGKAIAAWERTQVPRETPFDRYVGALIVDGERAAAAHMEAAAIAGAKLFIDAGKTQCLQCHNGPLLTNGGFHNVGTGTFAGANLDYGRMLGLQAVLVDEFNCLGPFSDAQPEDCSALRFLSRDAHNPLAGAFKTPSLRNVAATGPYMHDGRFADLSAVMHHYNQPPTAPGGVGHELRALGLTDLELTQLVAFLEALSEPARAAAPTPIAKRAPEVRAWADSAKTLLASFALDRLPDPPPDPGNRVYADADAAALGKRLFFDAALSAGGRIACASCHDAARGLADGRATAVGIGPLPRNAPSLTGVAHRRWLYWDGRKDSLWSQALEPIEAANEMGGNRLAAVRRVLSDAGLRAAYARVFGVGPDVDWAALPADASPRGDAAAQAAWAALTADTRDMLNTAFSNLGKAVAAYEREFAFAPSRFDLWLAATLAGDERRAAGLLSELELSGLRLFISGDAQCVSCHNGPRFTDGRFHNIGTGDLHRDNADRGRAQGRELLAADEFNCASKYSDDYPHAECTHLDTLRRVEIDRLTPGAFRTPGLRNLAQTAPYMHDGRFATIEEVLRYYTEPPDKNQFEHELSAFVAFDDNEIEALAAFLRTLSEPAAP